MLFDPPESNVNPFLLQARIRAMRALVLALTIHDQEITMVKQARISFTVRTGLTLPLEARPSTEAH